MAAKKIRYLLEERDRYYYQRKIPKALVHYVGSPDGIFSLVVHLTPHKPQLPGFAPNMMR